MSAQEASVEESPQNIAQTHKLYSITTVDLEKRLGKRNYGRISTQLFAGFIACLAAVSFGTAIGWSSPISSTLFLQAMFNDDDGEWTNRKKLAWLVSMVPLGCSIGVISCTFLMKQMGPRKTMLVLEPFYVLIWLLMLIKNDSVQLCGRFFLGFLGIAFATCSELLLLQTIHNGIRQYISVFQNSAMYSGILMCHICGSLLSERWLTGLCTSIPILHFLLLMIIPESPVFLYASNSKAASDSVAWYRGRDNIYEEMSQIRKDWDISRHDSDAYKYMLFSKVVYKGILIVVGVTFFQVMSGYFIFLYYSIHVWNNGEIVISQTIDSTICGIYFLIFKLLWGTIHVAFPECKVRGRLISSCFIVALSLSATTIYLALDYYNYFILRQFEWLPLLLLAIFVFFFDMGLNHYPKILIFEYMPFQVYTRSFSIIHILFWFFIWVNIFSFAKLRLMYPPFIIFSILSGLSYIGILFVYLFVVEPKGKSLVEVQLAIGGNPVGNRGAFYRRLRAQM